MRDSLGLLIRGGLGRGNVGLAGMGELLFVLVSILIVLFLLIAKYRQHCWLLTTGKKQHPCPYQYTYPKTHPHPPTTHHWTQYPHQQH